MKIEDLLKGTSDADLSAKMKRVNAVFCEEFGHVDPEARSGILLQTAAYMTSLIILDGMATRRNATIKDMIVDIHMVATGLSSEFQARLLSIIETSVLKTLADMVNAKKKGR